MPASRFDPDEAYALEGDRMQKLEHIARRLDNSASLSFDARRDLANLINLILSEAVRMEKFDDQE
jgi:hypothetical protein